MNEGFQIKISAENLNKKTYDDLRNKIIEFKNILESNFSGMRNHIGVLELQEAKNASAHEIMNTITNSHVLTNDQKIELTHL